jgi:drug/metabolite transporter (DMT)-like permease
MKTKGWALWTIILCTLCTSSAAILNKMGANIAELSIKGLLMNHYLIAGLILLATASVLLMISLKGGDVSIVYPVIATSYVWVTIFSGLFFHEQINAFKMIGIAFIVGGVITINLRQTKDKSVRMRKKR